MKYRRLGKTKLKVSVVGVGTWQFGGEWGKSFSADEVTAILTRAHELGVNLIDTAECYGDHLSESLIGSALADGAAGMRGQWVIATKFGHHFHNPFEREVNFTPDDVRLQLEGSLKALRTDYVDLYQFHSGTDEALETPGLWEALQRLRESGKIRHLGISIGANTNVRQTAAASDLGAEVIQVIYNRIDRAPERGVFPECVKQDLGVLARVPLASGFLSGKYRPGDTFPDDDVRERWYKDERDKKLAYVHQIIREEAPAGIPMPRWALAWCLLHPAVACVIPGCKTVEQVEDNAAAANLAMVSDHHPLSLSA